MSILYVDINCLIFIYSTHANHRPEGHPGMPAVGCSHQMEYTQSAIVFVRISLK